LRDLIDDVTAILFESAFMTLATVDGKGVPWATPVEFVCDEELRFYWTSLADSRHSQNVRENPRAALSIYDSTQTSGVRAEIQGVYAEGPAAELTAEEAEAVRPSLGRWLRWRDARRPRRAPRPDEPTVDDAPWRTYRLTPTRMYAQDPRGHPSIPGVRVWRVELDLRESFSREYRSRLQAS